VVAMADLAVAAAAEGAVAKTKLSSGVADMTDISDASRYSQILLPLLPILAVMLTGLFCIFRFFRETTEQRMARLSDNAKACKNIVGNPNDPESLGSMIGQDNRILRRASGSTCHSSSDGDSCGDGGSGE
jgi:hypothetical protein